MVVTIKERKGESLGMANDDGWGGGMVLGRWSRLKTEKPKLCPVSCLITNYMNGDLILRMCC